MVKFFKYIENSAYKKQVIFKFITLLIYYVFLTVMLVSYNLYREARNETDLIRDVQLEQINQKFDYAANIALDKIEKLKSMKCLNDYAKNIDDYASMTEIFNSISEPFTYSIRLNVIVAATKLTDKRVILPNHVDGLDKFCTTYGLEMEQIENFNYDLRYEFIHSSKDYLVIKCNEILPTSEDPMVFFIIMMQEDILAHNTTREMLAIANNHQMLFLTDNRISTGNEEQILDNLFKNIVVNRESGKNIANVKLDNYYAKVTFSKVYTFKNLAFVFLVHRDIKAVIAENFDYIFIWMFAALFLLGVYYVVRNAKMIYEPIVRLKKLLGTIYGEEFDDKDEWEFIEESTRKISVSYSQLLNQGEYGRANAINKFYTDCILGLLSPEDAEQEINRLKLRIKDSKCLVGLIDIINIKERSDSFIEQDDITLMEQIRDIFGIGIQLHMDSETLILDKGIIAQIIYSDDLQKIKSIYTMLTIEVGQKNGVRTIVGLGCPVGGFNEIHKSYQEAKKVLNIVPLYDRRNVFLLNEIVDKESGDYIYYPLEQEKLLITYILSSDNDKAMALLNEILSENLDGKMLSSEANWKIIFSIVGTINRILQAMNIKQEEVFGEETLIHLELKMAQNPYEFKEKVIDVFNRIIEKVNAHSNKENKKLAGDMLKYVDDNYNKDISLIDLAARFNMSVGYVSFLFKKATGHNFKEYLDMRRIAVAKNIMNMKKNIKINDVSDLVGCTNANTFIRMFKRYEGIAPGKYLDNVRKNSEEELR